MSKNKSFKSFEEAFAKLQEKLPVPNEELCIINKPDKKSENNK